MQIDALNPADLASQYYYLDQMQLNTFFTPDTVENNGGDRYLQETGYRPQDLDSMIKKLNISQNKYYIIRLMRRGDITALLYLLEKDKLVNALNLFPRSKLILFLRQLPKEVILKLLLWVIPVERLMQLFPTEVIFNILRSKRLEVRDLVKGFENMPLDVLQRLMGNITSQNVDKLKHKELMAMFRQLKKEQIVEGLKSMDQRNLLDFITFQVKRDPELLMMVPRENLFRVIDTMPKPSLIELFQLLPDNLLVQFLSQLPDKALAAAASQIDDSVFSSLLANQYPDLVASLAAVA